LFAGAGAEIETNRKKLTEFRDYNVSITEYKMPYTVDIFTSWPTTFASWDALRTWLSSEEGGSLRVIEPKESPFALIRYVKGKSNFALPHVAWCRSVVVEKEKRLPVAVSPPKASELTESSSSEATIAEELVDGTMINLFTDNSTDSEVYLATRSRLNADTKFYEGGSSFADMLQDALQVSGVMNRKDLLACYSNSTACFTSIVLQHPNNRIVQTIAAPSFTIIHQGFVDATGLVTIEETPSKFMWTCLLGPGVTESARTTTADVVSCTAAAYSLEQIRATKTVATWVSDYAQKHGFSWQGLVLKDGNGRRWRVRSQVYETVRQIRGNESSMEERFARLRKSRSVDQYLAFFPEDREILYELEGRFRKNTKQLFQFYTDVFRTRKTVYYTLPWPYKHHVSVLHNIFKDLLKAVGKKVDLEEVIRYTNGLSLEDTANMTKLHKLELRVATEVQTNVAVVTDTTDYSDMPPLVQITT